MTIDLNRVAVLLPSLNAEKYLERFPGPLLQQGIRPDQVLIVDSASTDKTVERALSYGFRVHRIARNEFNHGGTRRLASTMVPGADFLVYMTPDAIMAAPDTLARILSAFEDEKIGAAYGRQLPHVDADAFAMHHCKTNYPATSWVREYADRAVYAYKTVYLSDSFTAYRRTALEAVGGFPERIIGSEDFYIGAKLLKSGWKLAYRSDALVYHSHNQTIEAVFRRYFDIGVMQAEHQWILDEFGKPTGAGLDFIRSEIRFLLHRKPVLLPKVFLRTMAKYSGYQLGRRFARLPRRACIQMGSFREYWKA